VIQGAEKTDSGATHTITNHHHKRTPHSPTTELIKDDQCSSYFRACGGPQAATRQLLTRVTAASAMPCLPVAKPAGAGAQAHHHQHVAEVQEALLQLLVVACSNEMTLEEVAAGQKLLPAVVKLLSSSSIAVRLAAAALLSTATTQAKPKQHVCTALTAQDGGGLARLLGMIAQSAADAADQATPFLQLAASCMDHKAVLEATARLLTEPQHASALDAIRAQVTAVNPGKVRYKRTARAMQAFALIGKMCGHTTLRRLLATDALVEATLRETYQQNRILGNCAEAAASALVSLSAEPSVQLLLSGRPEMLAEMLHACCSRLCAGPVSARLAAVLARVVKQPEGVAALERAGESLLQGTGGAGVVQQLVEKMDQVMDYQIRLQTRQKQPPLQPPEHRQSMQYDPKQPFIITEGEDDATAALQLWLDAIVRVVATLTGRPRCCDACSHQVGAGAIAAMARVCSGVGTVNDPSTSSSTSSRTCSTPTPAASEGLAGNAALCLSHFAAENAWWPVLLSAGAVEALLAVARLRRGSAAARNAGIALAKAAGDGGVRERLRELRGFEVIYEYVRP